MKTYNSIGITEGAEEIIGCSVVISQMNYGLSRIKVPDSDDAYCYVPSVTFEGNVSYYDKNSGDVFYLSNTAIPFLTLNTTDCTVIQNM